MTTKEELEHNGYEIDCHAGTTWKKTILSASKMSTLYIIHLFRDENGDRKVSTQFRRPNGLSSVLLNIELDAEPGMDLYQVEVLLAEMFYSLSCMPYSTLGIQSIPIARTVAL